MNDVGVTRLYGIDDIGAVLGDLPIRFVREHSFTPPSLTSELKGAEGVFFRLMFTGRIYSKIYRLYELST